MRTLAAVLTFGITFAVYLLTPIDNRSEAEDAYMYARQVEGPAGASAYHPRHMLYIPSMHAVYRAAEAAGYRGRAHPVMVAVSAACGAGAVTLLAVLCASRFNMSRTASLLTAGMFAATYGFWRYACEAEIYAPATCLSLLVVLLASSRGGGLPQAGLAGAVAALSVLVHVLNLIPAFLVAPFCLLRRRGRASAAAFVLVAAVLLVGAYALAPGGDEAPPRGEETVGALSIAPRLAPSAFPRAAVGLGQALVSGNLLFTLRPFRDAVQRAFPHRVFLEEFQMGEAVGLPLRAAGWTATLALVLIGSWTVAARICIGRRPRPGHAQGAPAWGWPHAMAGMWFVGYAALILVFEPGNPEMWIMGLAPLSMVAGFVLVEPLVRQRGARLPGALLAALVVHNLLGGLLLLAGTSGDYNASRAAWALEHTRKGDTLFTAGSSTFTRYLRYYAEAEVVVLPELAPEEMERRLAFFRSAGDAVYALNDVFEQPEARRVRFPASYSNVLAFAEAHREEFVPVAGAAPVPVHRLNDGR